MDRSEIIPSLKWHLEVKNVSLQKALTIRKPLSIQAQKDLRLYYSQYFYELLSATEMLKENNIEFMKNLEREMCFDGFPDGKKNYSYIKELRNSIIHRGHDISNPAHFDGDFPMLIAPEHTNNRKGSSYQAFDFYLIGVISKCELVIPKVIHEHLEKQNFLEIDVSDMTDKYKQAITDSIAIPENIKNLAMANNPTVEIFESSQKNLIKELVAELEFNAMTGYKR